VSPTERQSSHHQNLIQISPIVAPLCHQVDPLNGRGSALLQATIETNNFSEIGFHDQSDAPSFLQTEATSQQISIWQDQGNKSPCTAESQSAMYKRDWQRSRHGSDYQFEDAALTPIPAFTPHSTASAETRSNQSSEMSNDNVSESPSVSSFETFGGPKDLLSSAGKR
jgi:hypothetical protein